MLALNERNVRICMMGYDYECVSSQYLIISSAKVQIMSTNNQTDISHAVVNISEQAGDMSS